MAAGTDTAIYGGAAGVTVDLAAGTGSDAAGDTLSGIENLSGSQGHDILADDAGGNQAFSLIGSGLYTGAAGQLRYAIANGITTIALDFVL